MLSWKLPKDLSYWKVILNKLTISTRHCEERSDVAIPNKQSESGLCRSGLPSVSQRIAMTPGSISDKLSPQ